MKLHSKRLEELVQELSELNEERTKLKMHWDLEKRKNPEDTNNEK